MKGKYVTEIKKRDRIDIYSRTINGFDMESMSRIGSIVYISSHNIFVFKKDWRIVYLNNNSLKEISKIIDRETKMLGKENECE